MILWYLAPNCIFFLRLGNGKEFINKELPDPSELNYLLEVFLFHWILQEQATAHRSRPCCDRFLDWGDFLSSSTHRILDHTFRLNSETENRQSRRWQKSCLKFVEMSMKIKLKSNMPNKTDRIKLMSYSQWLYIILLFLNEGRLVAPAACRSLFYP